MSKSTNFRWAPFLLGGLGIVLGACSIPPNLNDGCNDDSDCNPGRVCSMNHCTDPTTSGTGGASPMSDGSAPDTGDDATHDRNSDAGLLDDTSSHDTSSTMDARATDDAPVDTGPRTDVGADVVDGGAHVSSVAFYDVSASGNRTCGVRDTREIICWGEHLAAPPPGPFSKVAVGGSHACALTTAGAIVCWGENSSGQTNAPVGTFRAVAVGNAHSCGHFMDQSLTCWGDDSLGQASPVPSSYGQLTAGGDRTCALGFDYVASCWGYGTMPQVRPASHFTKIATGATESCGLRMDVKAISCWNPFGSELPFQLAGDFTELSVGASQICAVDVNSSLSCWTGTDGRTLAVPPGTYTRVSAGYAHVCALNDKNRVVCWGDDSFGQATPQ
jgi:hypothetical protein